MTLLRLQGASVARGGRTVVGDVDARFAAGRLTVVIGPNGAGKSTLLEAAAGLRALDAGQAWFDGRALADWPRRELARRRAYLPQAPRVDWPLSVERVVTLGLTAQLPAFGGLPATWRPRIAAALARFDLSDLADRPATELSGGELARVMLARATVGEPALLIVDEPTAGLDPRHALDAGARLRALADAGCAVVVALHDLDLAARIADDVVALKDGRLVAQGLVADVLTDDVLGALYDVRARVTRDAAGMAIRFETGG